jgi:hypothetical protein
MLQILEGSIVCGKSGKPLEVVAINGGKVVVKSGDDLLRVDRSAILRVLSSPEPTQLPPQTITGQSLHIGDRVTLLDKFMVRAADVGSIQAITGKGIQVLWDNKSPHEPNLKQPPILWRTFRADELELVESKYNQN